MSARPGRPRYTDEATVATTAVFLADPEQAWREDAARLRVTLGAITVELSRLYLDPDVRALILGRVQQG